MPWTRRGWRVAIPNVQGRQFRTGGNGGRGIGIGRLGCSFVGAVHGGLIASNRRAFGDGRFGLTGRDDGFGGLQIGTGRDGFPRRCGQGHRQASEHQLVVVLGDRQHCAITGATQQRGVDTGKGRCHSRDLVLDLFRGGEVEVFAQTQCELRGDAPVRHGRALGRDLAGHSLHAPFEVGDGPVLLAPCGDGEEHIGGAVAVGDERVHRDREAGAGQPARGETGVRAVAERVRAEQDERTDPLRRGGLEDAERVHACLAGYRAPEFFEPVPASFE